MPTSQRVALVASVWLSEMRLLPFEFVRVCMSRALFKQDQLYPAQLWEVLEMRCDLIMSLDAV